MDTTPETIFALKNNSRQLWRNRQANRTHMPGNSIQWYNSGLEPEDYYSGGIGNAHQ
jgi:hypothetical protein